MLDFLHLPSANAGIESIGKAFVRIHEVGGVARLLDLVHSFSESHRANTQRLPC